MPFSFQPDCTAIAFDQARQNSDYTFREWRIVAKVCQLPGHFQPFFPVIVFVAEKVLADPHHHAGADSSRQHECCQEDQRDREKQDLECIAPFTAECLNIVTTHGQEQQITTCEYQGSGVKYR